jgi:hypothetical protein
MAEQNRKRGNLPEEQPTDDELLEDTEEMLDIEGAGDAVTSMEAREHRRDSTHRTGGDNYSPGIDTDIDSNAPKEQEMPDKKRGGSKGRSDWR